MWGKTKSKEEDKPKTRNNKKASAVDIQALIHFGSKKSVTNRTIAGMTTEEQATTIIGSAEKTIMKEAKKGLRKEAMKVCSSMSLIYIALCLNFLFQIYPPRPKTRNLSSRLS
jgi:hypothetical protein